MTVQSVHDAVSLAASLATHLPTPSGHDREQVERLSLIRVSHRGHGTGHYWATTQEAEVDLGVTQSAARHMMLADHLPYVTAPNGRRYVRRHQLDVIANACDTRLSEEALRARTWRW